MCQGCASEYINQVNVCASDAKWSYCRCESTSVPVRVGSLSGLNPIPVGCNASVSLTIRSPSRSANGWELPNRAFPEHTKTEDLLFFFFFFFKPNLYTGAVHSTQLVD